MHSGMTQYVCGERGRRKVLDAQTIGDGEGERGALAKAWVLFKFYGGS